MIYYEMKYTKWKRDCYVLEHDPQANWLKGVENYSEQNKSLEFSSEYASHSWPQSFDGRFVNVIW